MRNEPVLVVVGTGPQLYREYLLRSLGARYRIHLITPVESSWESPYLDDVHVAPLDVAGAVTAALRDVTRNRPVAGVLTWDEGQVVETARAAEVVGLPGPGYAAAVRCRDKSATRAALALQHVPQPRSVTVGGLPEALLAAETLGYPVVLKPRGGGASEGVVLVHDAATLTEHVLTTGSVRSHDLLEFDRALLVEEFLDGPEISVDAAVHDGRVTPVHLARKQVGFAPFFEETGHTVLGHDPLMDDPRLRSVLEATHAALDYRNGWTHTELRITAAGPHVIEVNGRLGGDLIPYLGLRATGIDAGLAAADVACGHAPGVREPAGAVAAIRFVYPPWPSARLVSIEIDRTAGLPVEVDVMVALVAAGDVVSPPGKGNMEGRVALATAVAGSVEDCTAALDRGVAAWRCRWEPEQPLTT